MRYFDRIPVIKNGCCCCDLQIMCTTVGIVQVFVLILDFIAQIEWMYSFGIIATIKEFGLVDFTIIFVDMLVNIALITTTVFFVVGAGQKNTVQISIYVFVTAWVILLYLILGLSFLHYSIEIGFSYLFLVVWLGYVWIHAHSLHQKWIKEPDIRNLSTVMGRLEAGDLEETDRFCVNED